ncbi:MAG: Smr/MutS family protein, partial [Candidatus Eremiobacteraeota bacterium]|nr:Smr/MutS family protein [Candidatus Eremiobacteraeota bacterium]
RAAALERERSTLARQADDRLGRALREFVAELERRNKDRVGRAKVTSGQASLLGRVLDDVHRDLGLEAGRAPAQPGVEKRPRVVVGDRVFVDSLQSAGDVVDDFGDGVLVAIGSMKTVVPKAGLRVTRRAADVAKPERPRSRAQAGEATLEAATGARTELDVRGKRYVEAEPVVDKWIDESSLLGLSPLRLIHGKGTGLLGRGLQQWLKERSGIKDVRYGNADEGGGGVTVFELA